MCLTCFKMSATLLQLFNQCNLMIVSVLEVNLVVS
jgi:hypothetical protein